MSKMEPHNLHNIKRNFEKKTGTRLLPYADDTDTKEPRKNRHPIMAIISILLCVVILLSGLAIAFPYLRNAFGKSADSMPPLSESLAPSDSESKETTEETKPTETMSIEEQNLQLVHHL